MCQYEQGVSSRTNPGAVASSRRDPMNSAVAASPVTPTVISAARASQDAGHVIGRTGLREATPARRAPEFAGVDLGLAEKLAVRAVATATGTGPEQVAARVRETGDLGQAAELMLTATAAGRPASLQVTVVVDTLHQIADAE